VFAGAGIHRVHPTEEVDVKRVLIALGTTILLVVGPVSVATAQDTDAGTDTTTTATSDDGDAGLWGLAGLLGLLGLAGLMRRDRRDEVDDDRTRTEAPLRRSA
jgi:MYXO-CTERM domain-containing protein